jgi:hypothetical protein
MRIKSGITFAGNAAGTIRVPKGSFIEKWARKTYKDKEQK